MEGENSSERAIPESVPPGGDGVQAAEAAVDRAPNPGPACTEREAVSADIFFPCELWIDRPVPDQRSREEAERQSRPYRPNHGQCRKPRVRQKRERERENKSVARREPGISKTAVWE